MVKIISVETRKNSQGEDFAVLILQGGLEFVKSKQTGKHYATARKVTVSSTFDETTARELIGTQLPGSVEKVACEPYEHVVEGGEVVVLNHTYSYNPSPNTTEEVVMGEHAYA